MAGLKLDLLLGATTPQVGAVSSNLPPGNRGFCCYLNGTGAVAATVLLLVSNDGLNFTPRATFTLSGTNTDSANLQEWHAFAYMKGQVTAISGTNAAVTLTMVQ